VPAARGEAAGFPLHNGINHSSSPHRPTAQATLPLAFSSGGQNVRTAHAFLGTGEGGAAGGGLQMPELVRVVCVRPAAPLQDSGLGPP